MDPAISVIIASYNRPELLRQTVLSILQQTLSPAEIVIVDDGSPIDVFPAVRDLGPTVKFHRQGNAGICSVRNHAVRLSTSPWIALCDNDDLWRPDKLERQMLLHTTHPDVEYSFTNFSIVTDDTWSESTKFDTLPSDFFGPVTRTPNGDMVVHEALYNEILSCQPVFPSSVMMSRSFYDRIGRSLEEFGHNASEDLELTLRCVRNAPIGVVIEPVVGIRKHLDNKSRDITRVVMDQIAVLEYALTHHNISLAARALVKQAIAARALDVSSLAFAERRFDLHKIFFASIPHDQRMATLRIKRAIASLPRPIATSISSLLRNQAP